MAALVFCTAEVEAQEGPQGPWTLSGRLSAGVALGDSDWSVRHPYYGGSSVTWETFRGTFSHGVHLLGNLELRRKYLGIRGTAGLLPQEFRQEAPAQVKELTLLLGGLSAVLYPLAGSEGRMEPFLSLGAGGQKATGEMDNTGFYLSGAMGLGARVGARISLDGGIEFRRLKYTQIDFGNNVQKDLSVTPVALFLGVRVGG
jgi:hypothetical protein